MTETLLKLLMEAKGELGGALMQVIPSDDEIIVNRMRRAKDIMDSMEIVLRTEGR